MKQTLYIPTWHPTRLNALMGNRFVSSAKKRKDTAMIFGHGLEQKITKATGKRLVEIIITVKAGTKGRRADADAYYKSCWDSLVKCGYLIDDSVKWCEHKPTTIVRGEQKSTTIILTDIN